MFGWIPIIGPIIDGVVSIFSKWQDTKLGMYKVDGTVDVEAIKASTNIIEATKDDIGIRLARDIIIFPTSIWAGLYAYDTLIAEHWPKYMWHVADFPEQVAYLPYAVITFLLGNIGLNIWRRR
jgi:hypothetical protein